MASFTTFMRKVGSAVQKGLPVAKRVGNVVAGIANLAGPALAVATGGTSEAIAKGVTAANRILQSA